MFCKPAHQTCVLDTVLARNFPCVHLLWLLAARAVASHSEPTINHRLSQVRGYGLSGDGHHITSPHPNGTGAALAMSRALKGSSVGAQHVRYINAHATSTPVGDEIEQQAVMHVFGERMVERIAVSSTKGATGHLLGAAGAVEAAFTVLALHHGTAPPTVNLERPDPPLLPLLVARTAMQLGDGPMAALCNSFGFGGTNASLLFTTPPTLAAA